MQLDLRIMELLASRICHDLVSPVSAINNGVELVQDIGGDVVDEAMKLIGDSAQNASHRLKVFRLAYGRGGAEASLSIDDVRPIVQQYTSIGKMELVWPDRCPGEKFMERKGAIKTLINLLLLSEEMLAYGGKTTLSPHEEDGIAGCRITVVGRNAQLSDSFKSALDGTASVEDITPRTIQAYITGKFAAYYGLKIDIDQSVSEVVVITLAITSV